MTAGETGVITLRPEGDNLGGWIYKVDRSMNFAWVDYSRPTFNPEDERTTITLLLGFIAPELMSGG